MEFDEIVVKESPGLCRCCLSEGCYKDLASEYTWMNENEVYADMLLECFDISITQHTEGPNGPNRLICEVCITRLRDACNFKKQVLDSEKKFIDMVAKGEFQPKMLIYQTQMKTEDSTVEEIPVEETEVEYLDEDIDFGDDEPLIKHTASSSSAPSASDITITLPVKGKRGRPRKIPTDDKKPKLDKPKTKAVAKDTQISASQDGEIPSKNTQQLFYDILEYSTAMPFKRNCGYFQCFYCDCNFYLSSELRAHYKSEHILISHDVVVKNYTNSTTVALDTSCLKCKICSQKFDKVDKFVVHLKDHKKSVSTDIKGIVGVKLVDAISVPLIS